MFVPSLSWQNNRFYTAKNGSQEGVFSHLALRERQLASRFVAPLMGIDIASLVLVDHTPPPQHRPSQIEMLRVAVRG